MADCKHDLSNRKASRIYAKSVIRMKISSGYKIHVSWLAAMIFANQFLRYGLKPQLLMNKSILS